MLHNIPEILHRFSEGRSTHIFNKPHDIVSQSNLGILTKLQVFILFKSRPNPGMDRLRLLLVKLGIDVYIELRAQIPVSESLVQQPAARLIAKRSLLRPSHASVWNLEPKKTCY